MSSTDIAAIRQVITAGPFTDSWDSLHAYHIPEWYQDAKFGIFIHWGVFSVPAFGGSDWYPREMYLLGTPEFQHHLATYGPHTQFGYKDFIPGLTGDQFDPDAWANLFRRAGAQYVVPVAEHHDGFAMYDTARSEWNATRMGPKRDVIGELARAVRKQSLTFGVSSHRAEHWWYFNGGMQIESDVQDARYIDLYGPAQPAVWENINSPVGHLQPNEEFLEDWLLRTCELVDNYEPQLVWFDWWIQEPAFQPYLQRFAAYYYNRAAQWERGVAINYKYVAFPEGTAVLDIERGQLDSIRPLFWQTDTSVSRTSWSYTEQQDYKPAEELISDLVDIVSKNGALLLNVGPRADGTIPEPEQDLLLHIGRWLQINGEAIYGTRPWKVYGEGPTHVTEGFKGEEKRQPFTSQDIRFTIRGASLYVTVLAPPTGTSVTITSLSSSSSLLTQSFATVELLGHPEPLQWHRGADGLHVQLPAPRADNDPFVMRILLTS